MRQIKFRAWDGKSMITPTAIINGKAAINKPCDINDRVLTDEDGVNYYCNWDIDKTTDYPLMQFIGLTDKNGVEIYDGDIIDIHQTVNGCNIFIVEWNKLGWSVKYGCNMITPRFYEYDVSSLFEPCKFTGEVDFEVIGNIHQNLELLEE